ncbi:hypothetical protein WEB32_34790 [Streptomyces netropsis]|uniref:Uncharacterized protein n=1 Tax=Streptomyces netropsis TaxID=55404 RepID=A0A7W7LJQ6_STRNE|nr:hypothetical protein [Streptomyces netropsis]MBB4890836.1 hypothetical protein [Streptomyces netropsis]GGR51019.1 hypothetical protein GCM10010219_65310 [Streptomyces netropsis]
MFQTAVAAPLIPLTPDAAISAFHHLRAVQAGDARDRIRVGDGAARCAPSFPGLCAPCAVAVGVGFKRIFGWR